MVNFNKPYKMAAAGPCVDPECSATLFIIQEEGQFIVYEVWHSREGPHFNVSALDVELHERDNEPPEFNLPAQVWRWLESLHREIRI